MIRPVLAAIMTAAGEPLQIEEVALPEPEPSQVLVRIGASGVCHSDLLFRDGGTTAPPPLVLGHEGAGVALEVGEAVATIAPGDRVICSWVPVCGRCWFCANGESHLCEAAAKPPPPRLRRADGSLAAPMLGVGSFAEVALVEESSLVAVQTDLPDEQLALIGCAVATGVGAVLNTARVKPGASVAVFGCGGVGQSAIQAARLAGAARVIAVDPVALKRETALSLGASDAVDASAGEEASAQVKALTGGRGADYAFETSGTERALAPAFHCLRRGGTLVLVGVQTPQASTPWTPFEQFFGERRVLGCFYGSAQVKRDFPLLVALAESGRLDLGALVSRRIALADVNDAFAAMERGEVIRSVIVAGA
jgi:S-(hydroxymethyl)glutathione dehydrogenase / alcohol dehydrogenase